MAKLTIDKFNFWLIPDLVNILQSKGTKNVEIVLTKGRDRQPKFSEIAPYLCRALDQEALLGVWIKDIPFCVMPEGARDHIILSSHIKKKKGSKCRDCFYYRECPGFPPGYLEKYGDGELYPIKDTPWEVMIEVEPRCNFSCPFCFNKVSFARDGRQIKTMPTDYVKQIINSIKKAGTKIVRFTGGEPLLRKDIFDLMKYAKIQGLEVRLNTNASLITKKTVRRFEGIVDNILIPFQSYLHQEESEITGYQGSLGRKINAVKLLKNEGVPIIRAGTVISPKIILNLDKMAGFIFQLPLDRWDFYRPIPLKNNEGLLKSEDIEILVKKLLKLRKEKEVLIANALPFCAIANKNHLNAVSQGALYDDGHRRLVIDPRNFVKPDYYLDKNLGNSLDILGAWHHPFMKRMRNLKYIPKECKRCRFVFKCRGGSRYAAKVAYGRYNAPDPLAGFINSLS